MSDAYRENYERVKQERLARERGERGGVPETPKRWSPEEQAEIDYFRLTPQERAEAKARLMRVVMADRAADDARFGGLPTAETPPGEGD